MPKYEVKKIKTFMGREGEGFNCTLYRNGKSVADVIDSANGGCYRWAWSDCESERVEVEIPCGKKIVNRRCTPEEATFLRHVFKQPDCPNFEPADWYVSKLIDLRDCKTKTLFRLKSTPAYTMMVLNKKFTPEVKKSLETQYGDQLEKIYN